MSLDGGDVGKYAQALLDRLAGRPSPFPLRQSTVEMMTTPQQPGHEAAQLEAANDAESRGGEPRYPAVPGQNLRGFGWDIDTPFSGRVGWCSRSAASARPASPAYHCGWIRVRTATWWYSPT